MGDDPLSRDFLGGTIALTDEIYKKFVRIFEHVGAGVLLRLNSTSVESFSAPMCIGTAVMGGRWPGRALLWNGACILYSAQLMKRGCGAIPFQKLMRNAALWVLRKPA